MGADGPLRCSKCKAYVNPFMQFHSYGKAFTCNFCNAVTQVPPEYQENIAPDGRRRDADERPELCRGSVEFVAPASFSVRHSPSMPAYHLALLSLNKFPKCSACCQAPYVHVIHMVSKLWLCNNTYRKLLLIVTGQRSYASKPLLPD